MAVDISEDKENGIEDEEEDKHEVHEFANQAESLLNKMSLDL